jgi:RNA polymerase sigma factor (sigma-70 family)
VDRALVVRAQGGDREAYELLARASVDRLFATACRVIGDADRAEDAVQATLVSIWRDLGSLRDPDRFEAWTYRLVARHCLTELRRRRRVDIRALATDDRLAARTDELRDAEVRDQLEQALRALSPDHRTVVVLHHYVGLPLTEVAEILGVPYGTVGSWLHHALRALRAAVEAGERTPLAEGQPA